MKNDKIYLRNKSIKAYEIHLPDLYFSTSINSCFPKPILVWLYPDQSYLLKYQEGFEITLQIELKCIYNQTSITPW